MSAKTCENCGKQFDCGATASGCWCQHYTLPVDALTQLKTKYADCLCPECLKAYTEPKITDTLQ